MSAQASNHPANCEKHWSTVWAARGPKMREAVKLTAVTEQVAWPTSQPPIGAGMPQRSNRHIPCQPSSKAGDVPFRHRTPKLTLFGFRLWGLSSCRKIVTTEVFAHFHGRNLGFFRAFIWQDPARDLSALNS